MNFKLQRENFRSKKISAEEATKTAIDKVKKDNLNIFINHFEEEAITKAKHIDNNFDKFDHLGEKRKLSLVEHFNKINTKSPLI